MTTYNTGNPLGSTDARDLYDNAKAFDEAVNSTGSTYTDRTGASRKTLKWMETAATGVPAVQAAIDAQTAKVAAENARDQALIAAGVFSTKAAGLAATASGKYFGVKQAFGNAIDLYLNNGGTAVLASSSGYGIGAQAEQIKAIEGAFCDDWPIPPDILIDCLDMHQYDGRVLPNRMALTPPSKNLYPLNTSDIRLSLGSQGTSLTKNYAIGADGVNTYATRIQWAGSSQIWNSVALVINGYDKFPQGTYKCVVALKSNTGKGTQSVRFAESFGNTTLDVTCDESGYVDRTFTFTISSYVTGGVTLSSLADGTDILIDRIRIFDDEGLGVPAWEVEKSGHVKRACSPRGTFRSDGLFIDATTMGNLVAKPNVAALPSFPANTTINSIFMLVCASVDKTTQDQSANLIQYDTEGVGVVSVNLGVTNSTPEGPKSNGSINSYPATFDYYRINILGEGFHIWGIQLDATTCRKYFDHGKYFDWGNIGSGAYSVKLLEFLTAGSSRFRGKVSQMAVWINRNTTQSIEEAAMVCMEQRLNARGKTLGSFGDVFISEGDSRNAWPMSAPGGPGWNHILAGHEYFGTGVPSFKNFNIGWQSSVLGNPGDGMPTGAIANFAGSSIYSRLPKTLELINRMHALGKRIIFTYLNDINDSNAIIADYAAYSAREVAYLQTIRNALDAGGLGSKLFLFTCTPKHTMPTFETPRANLNTLRRAYPASLIHGIIDVAADATLGTYSATSAPAGYYDTIHWNGAGAAIAANLAKAVIAPHRVP